MKPVFRIGCRMALVVLLLAAATASGEEFYLGVTDPGIAPTMGTAIGNGERNLVIETLETFDISRAGIYFEPLKPPKKGAQVVRVNIYEALAYPAGGVWPWKRGPLLKTASQAVFTQGERFYDVPIEFRFEKGKRYVIGFESVTPAPWGDGNNRMRFWNWDPAFKYYHPYDVKDTVRVLDGGFNDTFANRNFPHIRLGGPQVPAGTPEFASIPCLVNLYPNAAGNYPATDAEIESWITSLNELLKPYGLRVDCQGIRQLTKDQAKSMGDANNDGDADGAEYASIRQNGEKELDSKVAAGKGYKFSYFTGTDEGSPFTYHKRRVTFMHRRTPAGGEVPASSGHELMHSLTLGAGHKLDATHTASNGGHTNNAAFPDNWMVPYPDRTGTKLTPDQISEIKKGARSLSPTVEASKSPAVTIQQQFGYASDLIGDASPAVGHLDLDRIELISDLDSPVIQLSIALANRFDLAVNAAYVIALDADNNALTGATFDGTPGIEYVLELTVTGSGGIYSASGVARRLLDNLTRPLVSAPQIEPVEQLFGANIPAVHVADELVLTFAKSLVGLDTTAATQIPIHVASRQGGFTADQADLVFDLLYWQKQPELTITSNCVPQSGQPMAISLVRMPASSAFDILVNDTTVGNATTGLDGSYSGSFLFPALPSTEVHFVSARDVATGKSAFTVTCQAP